MRRFLHRDAARPSAESAGPVSEVAITDDFYSTSGPYGLDIVSDPDVAVVDIVFVHGLTGNRQNTWTDEPSKTFWPQALLAKDLSNARIMTYGYDADVMNALQPAGQNSLRDHGNSLANDLSITRMQTNSNNRPLILVGHSLGGLVCEKTLLICRGSAQKHLSAMLDATHAVAFMGTPHAGADLANWSGILKQFARLSPVARPNMDVVNVLKPGSEMLADLQQEFHTMLDARRKDGRTAIELFCFFEELPVSGVGMIVPKHSAILTGYGNRSIHGTHMSMTKFAARSDAGYNAVYKQLWVWLEDLGSNEGDAAATAPGQGRQQPTPRRAGLLEQGGPRSGGTQYFGSVNSNGGMVFQGNQSASGDINFNSGGPR